MKSKIYNPITKSYYLLEVKDIKLGSGKLIGLWKKHSKSKNTLNKIDILPI